MLEPGKAPDVRWAGQTVVCIASGPSLCADDLEYVHSKHTKGLCKVVAVNREFEYAPWADVLYAADYRFWAEYLPDIHKVFRGELWTLDKEAAKRFKLNYIRRGMGDGYSSDRTELNTGGNSGYQAIHLAVHFGASKVVLLGYDMQPTNNMHHHFGAHRNKLPNPTGYKLWVPRFKYLFSDLKRLKVEAINATRATAIPDAWVKRIPISEAL